MFVYICRLKSSQYISKDIKMKLPSSRKLMIPSLKMLFSWVVYRFADAFTGVVGTFSVIADTLAGVDGVDIAMDGVRVAILTAGSQILQASA